MPHHIHYTKIPSFCNADIPEKLVLTGVLYDADSSTDSTASMIGFLVNKLRRTWKEATVVPSSYYPHNREERLSKPVRNLETGHPSLNTYTQKYKPKYNEVLSLLLTFNLSAKRKIILQIVREVNSPRPSTYNKSIKNILIIRINPSEVLAYTTLPIPTHSNRFEFFISTL